MRGCCDLVKSGPDEFHRALSGPYVSRQLVAGAAIRLNGTLAASLRARR